MRERMIWRAAAVAGLLALTGAGPRDKQPTGAVKSGIDREFVAPDVRPQDDLFRHVSGKWLANAPIPPDRSNDGAFYRLRDQSEADLKAIIERTAAEPNPNPDAKKVGDLFASFMDEARVEELGLQPVRADLDRVKALADKPAFLKAVAELGRTGVEGPFGLGVNTDDKKSDEYIIIMGQGGLGLPDESYYRDDKFKPIREAYVKHVAKMFELAGWADPKGAADRVMALETRLAKNHWDRVKSRDATLTYNKKSLAELAELTPGLDWAPIWAGSGITPAMAAHVIVGQPSYFTALAAAVKEVPLADWQDWLGWNVLRAHAPALSKPFVDENFAFYGKTLTGAQELKPRWKRGVAAVEGSLGEVVGKLFVAEHFPPAAKERMNTLVANLTEAYRRNIQALEWMSPETKSKALEKLAKFNPKIGYPKEWRDYSKLEIRRDDLVGNLKRAAEFEIARNLAKLGKPVDRDEWFMTPQTVNAYYNPGMNEIVFPAAILRPPFFDMQADDAVNYGGIGAVIGHEIGHGFDDQGAKYNGDGNMLDWWTDADRKQFEERSKKLIDQYSAFEPAQLPGQHVNGALTIGENIGDLGGLTIAYQAYKIALEGKPAPVLDGLTGPQRFFTGWAQVWRGKARDAELARRLATDPHSPFEFRCNGTVRNVPEFYEAFDVKPGDKLYLAPSDRVKIW